MTDTIKLFIFEHPIPFFFIVLFLIIAIWKVIDTVCFELPNRIIRGRNIRLHGWPPAHCDADGDAVEKKSL